MFRNLIALVVIAAGIVAARAQPTTSAPSGAPTSTASAPAGTARGAGAVVYNSAGGFKYTIPEGWAELPQETWVKLLPGYVDMGARQVLQPAGKTELATPRIVVIGQSRARSPKDGQTFAERFKAEQEAAIPAGSRGRLSLAVNEATFDEKTQTVRTDSALRDGDKIVYHTRGAFFLTPAGLAGFLLHARPEDLAAGSAALKDVAATVRLDEAPSATGDSQQWMMWVLVAGILVVAAMSIVRARRGRER